MSGMEIIRQVLWLILRVIHPARTGFFAAGAGIPSPGSAVQRFAAGACPATGTGTSGSGLSCPQVSEQARSTAAALKYRRRT